MHIPSVLIVIMVAAIQQPAGWQSRQSALQRYHDPRVPSKTANAQRARSQLALNGSRRAPIHLRVLIFPPEEPKSSQEYEAKGQAC